MEEEEACNEMVKHEKDTKLGDYYQILDWLKEFQDALKNVDSPDSKRTQSSLKHAL